MSPKLIVIGAVIGGIDRGSAQTGHDVTVLEANAYPGGWLRGHFLPSGLSFWCRRDGCRRISCQWCARASGRATEHHLAYPSIRASLGCSSARKVCRI